MAAQEKTGWVQEAAPVAPVASSSSTEAREGDEAHHEYAAAERQIRRKFDTHVLPWLFGLWLLAFIDRSNIGNARIDGLADELGLVGAHANDFNLALAIFYIPYVLVDVPSNWLVKAVGAGYYIPGLITAWGLISLCIGFVRTTGGLLAARFFLGLAEGGVLGGLILYLSMFYRRHELLKRITFFYCGAPLSGAFGGLLATGLARISTPDYAGWHFIFFVEGAITVAFGLVAACFLPHTPAQSRFLDADQQRLAVARLQHDYTGSTPGQDRFSWHWVRKALLNWNTVLLSVNFFAIITPIYSFSLFLPTLTKAFGYDTVRAQLLTVPPNILGAITVLLAGWASDRCTVRGPFMLVGIFVCIAGYAMQLAGTTVGVRYAGTFLVAAGVFPCSPLVMGWLSNNLHPHYVRATGTGFQLAIANLAAFIATYTYTANQAPLYRTGHWINIGTLLLAFVTTVTLMVYQTWENRRRAAGLRDARLAGDVSLLGHSHPAFRYTI